MGWGLHLPEGAVMLMTMMLNAIMMLMLVKIRLMTMMFNEMKMLMLVDDKDVEG